MAPLYRNNGITASSLVSYGYGDILHLLELMAARGNFVFAAAVSELFGNEKDSDCFLLFCIEKDVDLDDNVEALSKKRKTCFAPAGPVIFGEPMPAHTFVLRYVSDLFHAQARHCSHSL